MGITPEQFERLKTRMKSPRPVEGISAPTQRPKMAPGEVILGIDPSLRGTGYGVIEVTVTQPRSLGFGVIECPASWERSRCLVKIVQTLRQVLVQSRPVHCAMESLFYAQNLRTSLIMGEARGAALATIAEAGVPIYEIAPRKVKQAVVGHGAADKLAVAKMIQRVLRLEQLPAPDAADALALALAFAQENRTLSLSPSRKL